MLLCIMLDAGLVDPDRYNFLIQLPCHSIGQLENFVAESVEFFFEGKTHFCPRGAPPTKSLSRPTTSKNRLERVKTTV